MGSDEDFPLQVITWPINSCEDPRIEYFNHDEWDSAIERAIAISKLDGPISRIQVIDSWGMLVAQFTHRKIILGEYAFDYAFGKRKG
jgi:hypothetical protein